MLKEEGARAKGNDLHISAKYAIEICKFLRGKDLDDATRVLKRVLKKEQAIPFTRFTNGLGHKPGRLGPGRYPQNAAKEILKLLENAKANAESQGMTGTLVLSHIAANRAHMPMRNRAKERVEAKRTHVELIVTERAKEKLEEKLETAPASKPVKKAEGKQGGKPSGKNAGKKAEKPAVKPSALPQKEEKIAEHPDKKAVTEKKAAAKAEKPAEQSAAEEKKGPKAPEPEENHGN